MVVQTSDTTWQAYNNYGGNSLYTCTRRLPARRPAGLQGAPSRSPTTARSTPRRRPGRSSLFSGAEYPMIRFLEANGYDVSYISGVDAHRRGPLLHNHKLFISSGHDEYWSATQRDERRGRARRRASTSRSSAATRCFWKTRWEPSADGTSTPTARSSPTRTRTSTTPDDPVEWTGTWRDPRFTTAAERQTPENALTGQSFLVNSGTSRHHGARTPTGSCGIWRNTAVATLAAGQTLTLGARHARLRVGRGRRQRLPPGRPVPAVLDDRQRTSRSSPTTAARREPDGTATHNLDDVPGAERRARVRRRHRPVGLGPGRLRTRRHTRRTTTCSRRR